jgi:hypothetical protein
VIGGCTLGGECGWCHGLAFLWFVVDLGESALGEDVEAEVAASFGPFVVLFGQHGADEADDRAAVGEDADDVGSTPDSQRPALER